MAWDSKTGDAEVRMVMDSLVRRLEEDPEDFCCPISLCLMEDPVLAEDGRSYERKSIQEALRHRMASPLTNLYMGRRLVPDSKTKTAIVEFKEKVVEDIISHVPCMSPLQALKLLFRAEGFVREKLPDPAAKDALITILMLRARLPSPLRGDAISEFTTMCADPAVDLKKVVERFLCKLGLKSLLVELDDQTVARFCLAAHVAPKSACCHAVDREQVCRLAVHSGEQAGARKLWKFVKTRAACGNPEWVMAAGLVLAARYSILGVPGPLPCVISRKAIGYMQNPGMALSDAKNFFRLTLDFDDPAEATAEAQVKLLLDMCSQQEDEADRQKLLMEAHYVDPRDAEVLKQLTLCFTQELESKGKIENEDAFISFLLDVHGSIPAEFLSKMGFEDRTIRALAVEPEMVVKLAEQLESSGRGKDGAKILMTMSEELEEDGSASSQVKSQQASLQAYNMSGYSQEALHLVLSILSRRLLQMQHECREVQAKCSEQEDCIERLRDEQTQLHSYQQPMMTIEWDISRQELSTLTKGLSVNSPPFEIAATRLTAWFQYFPQGATSAEDGFASLYLFGDKDSIIECDLVVGLERKTMENSPVTPGGTGRGWANFVRIGAHKKISVIVYSVKSFVLSDLTYIYY